MTEVVRTYLIQRGANMVELQMLVRERIDEGWAPQGGVSVVFDGTGRVIEIYQAMVREKR